MTTLPSRLYLREQIRTLEKAAIAEHGIPDDRLMAHAGAAAFNLLKDKWPDVYSISVFCGPGNNGGDGYILARLAQKAGYKVHIWHIGDFAQLQGIAKAAAQACVEENIAIQSYTHIDWQDIDADLIVDAMLGIGLTRDVTGEWIEIIDNINQQQCPVLAIDIPSGLDADNGSVRGAAVAADATITFLGLKAGLFLGDGPGYSGEIFFDGLQVPAEAQNKLTASVERLSLSKLRQHLQPRPYNAHKGAYGHVLIIGGNVGMPGSVRMAAEAAARVGAGLVSIATHPSHAHVISAMRPEIMSHGIAKPQDVVPLMQRATTIVIGPGLGQDAWAKAIFDLVKKVELPLIVDADALNILAEHPFARPDWVLTPHPGEAARLLKVNAMTLQQDRLAAVHALQADYQGVVVLKGAGSLVLGADHKPGVCNAGNPGMATGGMGDVLTGVIAGLISQGLSVIDATRLAVTLHANAGDLAANAGGERGLLAMDLMPYLRQLVNECVKS